jgi:hypothetical protein
MFKPYPSFKARFSLKIDFEIASLLESVTDPIDILIFAIFPKKRHPLTYKLDLVST